MKPNYIIKMLIVSIFIVTMSGVDCQAIRLNDIEEITEGMGKCIRGLLPISPFHQGGEQDPDMVNSHPPFKIIKEFIGKKSQLIYKATLKSWGYIYTKVSEVTGI